MTVTCPISAGAQSHPDRLAVVADGVSLSYAELNARVDSAARSLQVLGVERGDHVALLIRAKHDLPAILWALFRLRAVAVLLSDLDPESRATENAAATGCSLAVSDIPIRAPVDVVTPSSLVSDPGSSDPGAPKSLTLDTGASIVFTSGSQARPKAAMHTLANHWFSARGSQRIIPVSGNTRWALVIPAYHVGGLSILFRCFLYGGTVVIAHRENRDPRGLTDLEATHVSVVPTQLQDWLSGPDRSLPAGFDTILVGGAATPVRIRREAIEAGWPVRFTYGSTEMASQIATTTRGDTDMTPGYAGRLLPYRELRIQGDQILVRGQTLFAGYWRDGKLEQPFNDDGWFATGDIGRLDGDRLFVTGRLDNRFISGGENVYPEEIEEAIISLGLADIAIVVPADDERFGARPVAYVRPMCSLESLRTALRASLPAYKLPDAVKPLPEEMEGSKGDRMRLARSSGVR